MLQIENTFFELGESCDQDCLIICDRGAMDAAACNKKLFIWYYKYKKKQKIVLATRRIVNIIIAKKIRFNQSKKTQQI